MIDYVFIKSVVPQCYVDINISIILFVTWDFITVDRGKLVSVLIIFIDDYFVFFRVGV